MESKKRVAILFGGQSSEHEVSCISAQTVIASMDHNKYEQILIGITKEGRWLLVNDIEELKTKTWYHNQVQAVLSPDAVDAGIYLIEDGKVNVKNIDVIFPVLHGMYGEDGTMQGVFELCKIPYVGCGVLGSSVSMDKVYTKIIVEKLGIRQANYVALNHLDIKDLVNAVAKVEKELAYPVFVKPSKAGSSQGVSKATNQAELEVALTEAVKHDIRVLVEETINGREIECAVLGGYEPQASGVGEVVSAEDFYTYEAKYHNQESKTDLHPQLPVGIEEQVRKAAIDIFKAVDGFSLSRVDFFLEYESNEIVFNEINTLPGFTSISMYPMLWADKGIDTSSLVDQLIESAFTRYQS